MKRFISAWNRTSLIKRIAIGVVIGAILGLLIPKITVIGLLGDRRLHHSWFPLWLRMPSLKHVKVSRVT